MFRTVVIKERSKLEFRLGFLVVRGEEIEKQIHLSEIDTLILESTAIAITASLLCELIKQNTNIVFCDEKHLPHSQLVPLFGNFNVSKNILLQLSWNKERKEIAWTKIIKEKIKMQAIVLSKHQKYDESALLNRYNDEILLNDISNREGHSAKVYFRALFGNEFSRDSDILVNSCLNYGYSILLSLVAREIIAAGYLTQVGIWHQSEYNFYNLASDFMEPFRPIVDDFILKYCIESENFKQNLKKVFEIKVKINSQEQYFPNAIKIFVRAVINFLNNSSKDIYIIEDYFLGGI